MHLPMEPYLATALWSSVGEDGRPLDDTYAPGDFAPEAVRQAETECTAFALAAAPYLYGEDSGRVAHDFWLTRNGHGAGFWDGDYPTHGEVLTRLAKAAGSRDIIVGDDGRLYFFPGA